MDTRNFVDTYNVKILKSRCKRFARSFRSMNPRNFGDTYNFKFLKSRYKRFARSYRSMNPRNFGDTSDVKFLKSRKIKKSPTRNIVGSPMRNDGIRTRSNCDKLEQTRTPQKTGEMIAKIL
jgi:hypothetical protein